jgi:hypothetical protein
MPNGFITIDDVCAPESCTHKQTQVTQALEPPVSPEVTNNDIGVSAGPNGFNCDGFNTDASYSAYFPYCCDPPGKYTEKWPVDPKYLFEHYYDDDTSDVMWSYADNYGNNNAEKSQPDPSDESGGELKLH